MSTETWGLMPKSQEDNEKVEEAISRLIAEHEADPEAHTGENESLAAHRENEVLDHLAGSVMADKISSGEILISTNFEVDTAWDWSGYQKINIFPGIVLRTDTTIGSSFSFYTQENTTFISADIIKDMLFQVTMLYGFSNSGDFNINFGGGSGDTGLVGLGFDLVDTALSGYYNDGVDTHFVSLGTISSGSVYTLRAFYNSVTDKIDFYINNNLIDSIEFVTPNFLDQELPPLFYGKKMRGVNQASLILYNLVFSRSL